MCIRSPPSQVSLSLSLLPTVPLLPIYFFLPLPSPQLLAPTRSQKAPSVFAFDGLWGWESLGPGLSWMMEGAEVNTSCPRKDHTLKLTVPNVLLLEWHIFKIIKTTSCWYWPMITQNKILVRYSLTMSVFCSCITKDPCSSTIETDRYILGINSILTHRFLGSF